MTRDEFIDRIWDMRTSYWQKHGEYPTTIEIPLEVEKSIAKFATYPLYQSVRTAHEKILGYSVKWDAESFEFTAPKKRVNPDPLDRAKWKVAR